MCPSNTVGLLSLLQAASAEPKSGAATAAVPTKLIKFLLSIELKFSIYFKHNKMTARMFFIAVEKNQIDPVKRLALVEAGR